MTAAQTNDVHIPSFAHYAQEAAYALSMVRRLHIDVRLATQVLLLQVAVVTLTLGIAGGLVAFMSHQRLAAQYETRSLDMARAIAFAPAVRADVARYDNAPMTPSPALTDELANGQLQQLATEIQQRTGVLFVVITNNQGIRLSHPNRDELGKHVSTDPSEALAGHEVVTRESGTLGRSVRAKVPVLAPDSDRVIGEVSIGISTAAVHRQLWTDVRTAAVLVGLALLIGVVGSLFLARRWRGLTMGLQPSEMAELIRGQAAVLHGIDEGVLAVDTDWKTTFVNDEACRLLELSNESGRPVEEIGLTPRVLEVFRSADPTPTLATVGDRVVVVSARHVARDDRDLGTVLVVRDRTDVESLTRQLDAVQLMSTVLRAQRHEFANRLHLINGLLHSGHTEEAAQYVEELLGSGPLGSALPGIDTVRDAFLQAFLAAKAASAREAGVTLTIGENTWVPGRLALPVDVTTVLGNLVDNAIDAARTGANEAKVVEVELLQDGSTLHITVADTGDGVAPDFVDDVFTEGTSTKPESGIPGGRGIGMALSRQISRALGGDVRLSSPGNPGAELCGAEFIAQLPGVMVEEEAQWVAQN
jgi:two-component system, CitB family, sensor kinase